MISPELAQKLSKYPEFSELIYSIQEEISSLDKVSDIKIDTTTSPIAVALTTQSKQQAAVILNNILAPLLNVDLVKRGVSSADGYDM